MVGLSLKAYNSSLECSFYKAKVAFCSSKKGLSNDVFRSGICDWSKSTNFPKAIIYIALRFFLKLGVLAVIF